jgi:hypothetical protein
MTATIPTTAGGADPQCIACGIEDACAYHAASGDTESAMRKASATVGRVREAGTPPARDDPARESRRDIAADLGIPAGELDRTPSVETLRAKSHAVAGRERELADVASARRDLARQVDLEPVTSPGRVREATRPDARSVARDLGLAEDELVPVERLREASARRSALVDRWRELEHLPATGASALDFADSLRELGELGRLGSQ